jgi:cardiolipin synthase
MQRLIEAIIDLVSDSPPDKTEQLAESIRGLSGSKATTSLASWSASPRAVNALRKLVAAWRDVDIPATELAGMLIGASGAYNRAKDEQEIELVWTGPSSTLIATRKTEQALLQVVNAAESRLFMTSFVVYNIASILGALERAIERGVQLSMLLEASDAHGGAVTIDAFSRMRQVLPKARLYSWTGKSEEFLGGKVHAKVAVADEVFCFISSANLTGHAMEKNMEAGVLIRGGSIPRTLHKHLEALETTNVISRV